MIGSGIEMIKLRKIGLVSFLFICSAFANASNLDILVEKMLFEDNVNVKKMAAKAIYESPDRTPEVGDALAYLLMDGVNGNQSYDLTAWAAKGLGATNNPRYLQVLESALATTKNSKIKKYVKGALSQIKKPSYEGLVSFDANQYDREVALKRLAERYNVKENVGDSWGEISVGNTIEETLAAFGMPYKIDEEINDTRHPYVGRIRTQRLALKYENIGYVTFGSKGGRLTVETISASYEGLPDVSGSKDARLINDILMGTWAQYKSAARSVCQHSKFSQEVLDASAYRAWSEKNVRGEASDGVAWLLKCIGASGNPRYRSILTDIKKVSEMRKVRKYANSALKSLEKRDVEQFVIEVKPSEDAQ